MIDSKTTTFMHKQDVGTRAPDIPTAHPSCDNYTHYEEDQGGINFQQRPPELTKAHKISMFFFSFFFLPFLLVMATATISPFGIQTSSCTFFGITPYNAPLHFYIDVGSLISFSILFNVQRENIAKLFQFDFFKIYLTSDGHLTLGSIIYHLYSIDQ